VRCAPIVLALCAPATMRAQRAALKTGLPAVVARATCPSIPLVGPPADEQRRTARELAQRARQSAILGDRVAARDQSKHATSLDPTDPVLAYESARVLESVGANDDAAIAYCRFLALTPNAPEAPEARDHLAALTRSAQSSVSDQIYAPFRNGISAYNAGRMQQAETLFSAAITLQPDWADAYYNRALTFTARGQKEFAVRDLQQYLRLKPEAEDRASVVARVNALRGKPLTPSAALTYGLFIPGAGQIYTGRTLFGLVALAAAGGVVAYAIQTGPVQETYQQSQVDPFGNPLPPFTATRTVQGHPHMVAGLAGAGAIGLASAIEAYVFARHATVREQRISASVLPASGGVSLRVSLR
jgi:tetratricopeptide (TPR) repeat protein